MVPDKKPLNVINSCAAFYEPKKELKFIKRLKIPKRPSWTKNSKNAVAVECMIFDSEVSNDLFGLGFDVMRLLNCL